jgi:hypothetical protein
LPVGEQIDTWHLGTKNTYAYGPYAPADIAAHLVSDAKRTSFCHAYDDAVSNDAIFVHRQMQVL